jgi:hypothetical protein
MITFQAMGGIEALPFAGERLIEPVPPRYRSEAGASERVAAQPKLGSAMVD